MLWKISLKFIFENTKTISSQQEWGTLHVGFHHVCRVLGVGSDVSLSLAEAGKSHRFTVVSTLQPPPSISPSLFCEGVRTHIPKQLTEWRSVLTRNQLWYCLSYDTVLVHHSAGFSVTSYHYLLHSVCRFKNYIAWLLWDTVSLHLQWCSITFELRKGISVRREVGRIDLKVE